MASPPALRSPGATTTTPDATPMRTCLVHQQRPTGEGVYRSQFLWMLGFPKQALAANAAAEANARLHGHPSTSPFC